MEGLRAHRLLILDVDDVVVDMDRLAAGGFAASAVSLVEALGADAGLRVAGAFEAGYALLRDALRAAPGEEPSAAIALRARIAGWQRGVEDEGYAPLMWSRQALLAVALEDLGLPVERALVDHVVGRYWAEVEASTGVLAPAATLIATARRAGLAVHLATSSDGHLELDAAARTFRYHPEVSRRAKLRRLRALASVGVEDGAITVGDPFAKPHPGFYARVLADLEGRLGGPAPLSRALAVGDSLTHDVLPFLALGVRDGAWLLRPGASALPGRAPPCWLEEPARVRVVEDLRALISTDWSAR